MRDETWEFWLHVPGSVSMPKNVAAKVRTTIGPTTPQTADYLRYTVLAETSSGWKKVG